MRASPSSMLKKRKILQLTITSVLGQHTAQNFLCLCFSFLFLLLRFSFYLINVIVAVPIQILQVVDYRGHSSLLNFRLNAVDALKTSRHPQRAQKGYVLLLSRINYQQNLISFFFFFFCVTFPVFQTAASQGGD